MRSMNASRLAEVQSPFPWLGDGLDAAFDFFSLDLVFGDALIFFTGEGEGVMGPTGEGEEDRLADEERSRFICSSHQR